MITLASKVPAKYERIVLEEYYKFYQFQNGERDILNKNIKFTMDESKYTDREINNKSLMDSVKTLKNDTHNILFLLSFDEEERLNAVTRLYMDKSYIHICDVVYPSYPEISEKIMFLNEIISKVEEMASINDQEIDFEIPTNDEVTLSFAASCGFKELPGDTRTYRTMVLTKKAEKREKDEWTLSRKQRKESN